MTRRKLEQRIVKAAMSWYYSDRPRQEQPSGLRIATTGDVWNPSPAEKRLAKRVGEYLEAGGKLGKRPHRKRNSAALKAGRGKRK